MPTLGRLRNRWVRVTPAARDRALCPAGAEEERIRRAPREVEVLELDPRDRVQACRTGPAGAAG
ncbi:hypothetical protein [Amycolatopsis stemonae]